MKVALFPRSVIRQFIYMSYRQNARLDRCYQANTISVGLQLSTFAILSLALSTAWRAVLPIVCMDDGFP